MARPTSPGVALRHLASRDSIYTATRSIVAVASINTYATPRSPGSAVIDYSIWIQPSRSSRLTVPSSAG